MERVSLSEPELIARQIGRAPRGEYAVALRCPHGFPRVLRVPPVVDGKPFPTLYWLSCPLLCRAVGTLEAEGWVGRLEKRVASDAELRAALEQAHEAYVAERETLGDCASGGAEPRGIGGIADRSRLKCLHLHVAHALVRANPIGRLVLTMLDATACPDEKKICSSLARERSRSQINR
jgi:hypothetical protein